MLEFEVVSHGWGVCAKAKGADLFVTGQNVQRGYMGNSTLDPLVLFELVQNGFCKRSRVVRKDDAPETMLALMKEATVLQGLRASREKK